jgi:quinoprotein glucose dehydrogenase
MKQLLSCLSLAFLGACSPDEQDAPSTWPTFGHDVSNNKFSALTDIDTSNVTQLQEAWRYEIPQKVVECTFNPVMMDNRVIGLMPSNKLVALDAVTGKLLWEFVPDSSAIPNWSKGMTYHPATLTGSFSFPAAHCMPSTRRMVQVINDFGNNGRVDFYEGLEVPDSMRTSVPVSSNAPGVVYNDLFIVGCKVPDELPSTPGDIRAFNINTGKLEWVFHVIPKPGEFGATPGTLTPASATVALIAGQVWPWTKNEAFVFVPTASPSFDFYGADRPRSKSFRQLPAGTRCKNRQAHLAFSNHAPRSLGSRQWFSTQSCYNKARRKRDRCSCARHEDGIPVSV